MVIHQLTKRQNICHTISAYSFHFYDYTDIVDNADVFEASNRKAAVFFEAQRVSFLVDYIVPLEFIVHYNNTSKKIN